MTTSGAIRVVCAVIEAGGKFLAAQRSVGRHNAGLWEFPGGKVDKGESLNEALQRELQEELGIEITITGKLSPVFYEYPHLKIELIPYTCTILKGTPFPREHARIQFVDLSESRCLQWAPADIPILEEYLAKRRKAGPLIAALTLHLS